MKKESIYKNIVIKWMVKNFYDKNYIKNDVRGERNIVSPKFSLNCLKGTKKYKL